MPTSGSIQAFAARVMNMGLVQWAVSAVTEVRVALEQENPEGILHEYKAMAVSQWIVLAGKHMFRDAFRAKTLSEAELKARAPGPLYVGKPGLCMERWWFWRKRFEELGQSLNGKAGLVLKQAVQHMKGIVEQNGRVEVRRLGGDVDDE